MTFNHIFNIPPSSDWINILILFFVITIIILISEIIRVKLHWSQEFTRKIVHISVGILLFLTPVLLETSLPLILIGVFFSVFNFVALRKGFLPGIHIDRNNYGTFYYAISFLILVLLFWGNYKIIIISSMMVMAVGDAAAAIIGKSIKNPKAYCLIKDKKTWNGSFAMFVFISIK
jgi:dolichol kinase